MGKSIRINISLPEQLHGIYAGVADRTGISLPQVLVNALAAQSAYTQRWIRTIDFQPRDAVAERLVLPESPARVLDGDGGEQLTRQQRRALARQERKLLR